MKTACIVSTFLRKICHQDVQCILIVHRLRVPKCLVSSVSLDAPRQMSYLMLNISYCKIMPHKYYLFKDSLYFSLYSQIQLHDLEERVKNMWMVVRPLSALQRCTGILSDKFLFVCPTESSYQNLSTQGLPCSLEKEWDWCILNDSSRRHNDKYLLQDRVYSSSYSGSQQISFS